MKVEIISFQMVIILQKLTTLKRFCIKLKIGALIYEHPVYVKNIQCYAFRGYKRGFERNIRSKSGNNFFLSCKSRSVITNVLREILYYEEILTHRLYLIVTSFR